ncbi:uridine 5'-monophosphate synthase-like [Planococcus citri]|uniref:uridine 5'-monophosphate synthase-like n=1 Tax=Planococcus citri TaxID=170843 RepID=UPI0031F7B19E
MDDKLTKLCATFVDIGCLKFGKFTLKSGRESTYYIDLRLIISYPLVLNDLCTALHECLKKEEVTYDNICGVPYTALPMATLVANKSDKPMVMRRKEPKSYGTKQLIEGSFKQGDRCIIIEDVISTGASILETIADVEKAGLVVKDVIAVFNREEGGVTNIQNKGYNVHCLFSLSEVVDVLSNKGIIDSETVQRIIEGHKEVKRSAVDVVKSVNRTELAFENRTEYCKSKAAAKLLSVMSEKKSNLCVAADVTDMNAILKLADEVGPHICIFKVHLDIVNSYSDKQLEELKSKAVRYNFLLMEDRKLADIGNTVRLQFNQISKWANLVTVHSIPGFGVLEAIKNAETFNENFGVFLIAELSSKDNLITPDYTKKTAELAKSYSDIVSGMVCQSASTVSEPGMIQLTPGVNLEAKNDNLGQQYNSPEEVITNRGADIAVVGRAIITAQNPSKTAEEYKKQLWNAYSARIK